MTQKEFKPLLVGRHDALIAEQNKSWLNLIACLNDLFSAWNSYFDEQLQLDELAAIMQVPDLSFYIRSKYVMKKPDHANFMKSLSLKMDKVVEMMNFPSFDHLIEAVGKVKSSIFKGTEKQMHLSLIRAGNGYTKRPGIPDPIIEEEFETWKTSLFNGENFEFTTELETEIRERNSFYTRNRKEDAALAYLTKFCEILNISKDLGIRIDNDEMPQPIYRCTNWRIDPSSDKSVSHFFPSTSMLDPERGLLGHFAKFDDTEIEQLIEKLQ